MPKYRDYFRKMLEENEELFANFSQVHSKYANDKQTHQEEFNKVGDEVMLVVREWEGRLCGHSEKGQYAKFSSTLADKFWEEVKAFFPLIDFVGVKVTVAPTKPAFVVNEPNNGREEDPDMREIDEFDPDEFEIRKLF